MEQNTKRRMLMEKATFIDKKGKTHEVTIFTGGVTDGYRVYYDDDFWTSVDSMRQAEDEIPEIVECFELTEVKREKGEALE